jgi:hypothetical protein
MHQLGKKCDLFSFDDLINLSLGLYMVVFAEQVLLPVTPPLRGDRNKAGG